MSERTTVEVNGEPREVPQGLNIKELVAHLGLTANRLAIERNLEIVPRARWETTQVTGGDRFEIVHLVGGGSRLGSGVPDSVQEGDEQSAVLRKADRKISRR